MRSISSDRWVPFLVMALTVHRLHFRPAFLERAHGYHVRGARFAGFAVYLTLRERNPRTAVLAAQQSGGRELLHTSRS
ncbi:MAG: hypothetical protein DMG57_15630 [Acidobacteria bacterium]|nr:MAG: hypothetical protein DMG57_15630 [Acidobacteriota bacterium]